MDAGDLFGLRNQEMKNQTEFLCEHTADLGYRIFGVGERDLNYGLEFLREMERTHGFEFVSANLRDGSGELLFPPYAVTEVAGLSIGIVSVLEPQLRIVTMSAMSDEFQLDSPRDALDRVLPELREKTDLVVLLAHMPSREVRELLLEMGDTAGIDIAIEGHDPRQYRRVNRVGNTYLLAANDQGKYVGQLDMIVSSDGIQDATLTMHALDKESPEIEEIQTLVDDFKKKNAAATGVVSSFVHTREQGSEKERFLGALNCQQCHMDEFVSYSKTAHARAFTSLTDKGQAANPDCVSCHVVGFNHANGYDRIADPQIPGRETLKDVQCEACHGYGTEHDRTGAWLAEAKASCTTCHDEQNSPNFDYETYWAKIAH